MMLWFNGSIRDAVDKVKSSGIFLLVFVQGKDDLSKKYEDYLNEETKFNADDYVAVKIPNDTVALQQFRQIYVTVPIPSVFLIQNNGIPLNIVSSDQTSDISIAITDAIKKQKVKAEKKSKIQTNEEEIHSQAESKSCEGAISKPSHHIKNIGRKVFYVTEEEIKKRLNEIRAFPRFLLIESPTSDGSSSFLYSSPKQQSARIQFRLPNNSMPSWEFPDLSTLGDVRAYLMEKMKLSSNFKLLRTYPRTSFTPQDELKTLAELSLTPSATLVVVPVEDKTVQAKVKSLIVQHNFLTAVVRKLLQPLFTFLSYFKKHFIKTGETDDRMPKRLPSDTAVEKIFNKKTSTSNIHGFKFDEDTDTDTEHPDNGNSTQQRFQ